MLWKVLAGVFFVGFVASSIFGAVYFYYYNTTPIAFYGNDVATWYTPGQQFTVETETGTYTLEVFSVRDIDGVAEHAMMFAGTRQVVPFLMSDSEIARAIGRKQLRPADRAPVQGALVADRPAN